MSGIIEADDLTKAYNDTVAVNHIRFSVQKSEVFGMLGPNGAGKTTTMRMIECVSPRTSGTLTVFGLDPDKNPAEIKQKIGVVPQESNLDIPPEEAKKRAESLLSFVALTEKRDVSVDKLSGGMKRRLILARALINTPDLLILDEPTIGLDPQARHLIWERLRHLRAEGKTIVLTTHYLDEAARLCDRLVIMDNGVFLAEGSPAGLVQEYAGSGIVEADNTPEVVACLESAGIPYEIAGDQVQVTTGDPREAAKVLLDRCHTSRVITRPATLEDVFLKLTGRNLRE